MKAEVPDKVSQEELTFHVSEIEPLLSGPKSQLPPFEPATIKLRDGATMVVRALRKDEAPAMLKLVRQLLDVDHDFYDIVGVRVYAEILGWMRNRLKDSYQMVGLVDGELAAFCNGRMRDKDVGISLHTLAFRRGGAAGAAMYYVKSQYTFEVLKQKEYWSTFESYNGWKRWGLGMAQPSYPWPDVQHELGGAKVYYITQDYWQSTVRDYVKQIVKADLVRPVPKDLLDKAQTIKFPDKPEV
jgi:hypothetical protein